MRNIYFILHNSNFNYSSNNNMSNRNRSIFCKNSNYLFDNKTIIIIRISCSIS